VRTPFGLAMQGIRDDPTRMRALGYNVELHRTVAFGVGAFIAALGGTLSVWFNTQISPGSISITQTIDVLIIAVVGGLYRLEGAWVGALFFALLDNYSRSWTPTVGSWLGPDRFATIIGIVFLVIVLASPGGLVGIWDSLKTRAIRALHPAAGEGTTEADVLVTDPGHVPATGSSPDPGRPEDSHALVMGDQRPDEQGGHAGSAEH
jgi:branched-chain amino acid transport system permease protein